MWFWNRIVCAFGPLECYIGSEFKIFHEKECDIKELVLIVIDDYFIAT